MTVVTKSLFGKIEALIVFFSIRNLEPYYFVVDVSCMHDILVKNSKGRSDCLCPFSFLNLGQQPSL